MQIVLRRKQRQQPKPKRITCRDCLEAEIRQNEGFRSKSFIYCHFWGWAVRMSHARICPHFCLKRRVGHAKRRF
ncbi:hypothetical protein AFULGI_00025110 [Archaeoglobus fulgidus DSM 8774]|uniref:Uncharacterized protein n=1 Tax=Archaeoglobus fulgidus DSM 8774 TaxID=1344584 RepID=A0A075WGU2_ARCFL|nr:hypothetical protein [Archaeoglobus fulgidus]AIG99226.1 hypothetical protein AFULGI_00025110 [Archaeoglobus fulgidus DSM 8774]